MCIVIGIDSEAWRPVPGFPGYEVSDLGRIRSVKRKTPKVLKTETDADGYQRIQLFRDGAYHHRNVHRLVALAFIGQPESASMVCCHRDNDPSNNKPSNLRWDTQAGNMADKKAHGTEQIGSRHPKSVISDERAAELKRLLKASHRRRGFLQKAAKASGVPYGIAADISRGKTWRHA